MWAPVCVFGLLRERLGYQQATVPLQTLVQGVTPDIRAKWKFQSEDLSKLQGLMRRARRVHVKVAMHVPSKRITLLPRELRLALRILGGKESRQTSSNGVS